MRTFIDCFKTSKTAFGLLNAALLAFGCSTPFWAQERVVSLAVDDPRPVAQAMLTLESLYGWAISYEDPRYGHADDLRDVTWQVRRDLANFPIGQAPRVLVPRGGSMTVGYSVSAETGVPERAVDAIQKVLDARVQGSSASFRLLQSGENFHVVPAARNNTSGILEPQTSILDAPITLPDQERDGVEMLEAICKAVGDAAHTRVSVGTIPENLFRGNRSTQSVFNTTARDVLTQTLAATETKLSWRLLYDPGLGEYFLNIHSVLLAQQLAADLQQQSGK